MSVYDDQFILICFRPFSSFKYMGWKRRFSRRNTQTTWSQEDEHVRILFRFDAIYNFTAIRLFLANDFPQDVSLPKNITVQCSLHYPASTDHRPDNSIPLVVSNPQPDRTDSLARWIVLIPSEVQWYTTLSPVGERGLTSSGTVGYVASGENAPLTSSLGVGRFVDIRLYFDAAWIILGEVAFENGKIRSFWVIIKIYRFELHVPSSSPQEPIDVSSGNP